MTPVSRYRLLLRAYPRRYRDARGEEMLAVLLANEERRGRWSLVPEAGSLVVHGLDLRVRGPLTARTRTPAAGIAGVGLLLTLAVLGAHQLAAMGLRGLGLHGYPESSEVWRLWVDPRWPIQLAWLATGVSLLLRRHRTTVALAWTAALLHAWLGLAEAPTGLALPWFGGIGPAWEAPFGAGQISWLVLTWLALVLVGGASRLAQAVESVPTRSWTRTLLVGILASTVTLAAPALSLSPDGLLSGSVRRAVVLTLVASSVTLVVTLRRASNGRRATLFLVLAALAPLVTRWNAPSSLSATLLGAAVFTAGYVLGTHRRSPDRSRPQGAVQ